MFSLSIRWGMRSDNPTQGVERNNEERRYRYLSGDELRRLTDALATHSSQSAANAIRLLLLTGARLGEVLSATWDQFDFEIGTWTKPSSHIKQKREHRVPLSVARLILRFGKPAVIEELERISREGRRRGAKEQEDYADLYEMSRIIAHAEYMGTKDFPIGRAARIIAERQNYKPGNRRNAKVKTLKRKLKKI
jgi:hypothetical protein